MDNFMVRLYHPRNSLMWIVIIGCFIYTIADIVDAVTLSWFARIVIVAVWFIPFAYGLYLLYRFLSIVMVRRS